MSHANIVGMILLIGYTVIKVAEYNYYLQLPYEVSTLEVLRDLTYVKEFCEDLCGSEVALIQINILM